MAKSRTEVGYLFRLLFLALGGLVLVSVLGTAGYDLLTDGRYPLFDSFYMTFVTISTIGFGEIIDMSNNTPARVLTVTLAVFGTGMLSMAFSIVTVIVLESDINGTLKRKRMEKSIKKLKDHYILCGLGRVGRNVANELIATDRPFVAIDAKVQSLDEYKEKEPGLLYLQGDASDDDVLRQADLENAAGLFAVTGDDSMNLMIVITAKQLRPQMRVVARCHEVRNIEKMQKAGADAIVSPDFTGGMRIASAMLRPHVTTFMDEMLKTDGNFRIEEALVPQGFKPRALGALGVRGSGCLPIALRLQGGAWEFNPPPEVIVEPGCLLMVMANADGRRALHTCLGG